MDSQFMMILSLIAANSSFILPCNISKLAHICIKMKRLSRKKYIPKSGTSSYVFAKKTIIINKQYSNQRKNKLPCHKQNVQKKQLKTCFAQIYRVKEGDEIYNYLPCPSFDDLLSFRLMHKRREVNDDQHSPCTVLFV